MYQNIYLTKAEEFGLDFKALNLIAINASKSINKSYSFLGCFTFEDLLSISWEGILSAVSQNRFIKVKNKSAYCFTFAKGYCQHALQRKSRVLRTPYSVWRDNPGVKSAHLSYSWDNLPEPSNIFEEPEFSAQLLSLAGAISTQDYNKLLKNNFNVSKATTAIIAKIKTLHEQEQCVS